MEADIIYTASGIRDARAGRLRSAPDRDNELRKSDTVKAPHERRLSQIELPRFSSAKGIRGQTDFGRAV